MNYKGILGQHIELVAYDFDGVMTDNKVFLREDGMESVVVSRADGLAVSIIKRMGIKQLIISSEDNDVVSKRGLKLGIPVIHGILEKREVLEKYCADNSISIGKVIYVGNDINDLDAMLKVGYPVCPMDAAEEIKKISKIIIQVKGGNGVVRELLRYME